MSTASAAYPIGTPGTPWGDAERAEWLSRQTRQRSYEFDVLSVVKNRGQIYFLIVYRADSARSEPKK